MSKTAHKGYTLQFTLSLLVIVSILLTAIVSGYSALHANKQSLSTSYLENNYDYAKKLSLNTTELIESMQRNLHAMSEMASSQPFTQRALDLWFEANQYFNSIVIVDTRQNIKAISPANTGISPGARLNSQQSLKAIELKKPLISEPYKAKSERMIVLISSPIFAKDGTYSGFVGGTIYLEENNALSSLLKEHFFGNGSYVFVVDQGKRLIFHPKKERINDLVTTNTIINQVVMGKSGYQEVVNSENNSFFAGYSYEPLSGWGIISQTPTSVLDRPLKKLTDRLLIQALPLLSLILLIVWWFARRISKPLFTLARFSEEAILHRAAIPAQLPVIRSKFYEVTQLYQSINAHINLLSAEIQLDGLTGLANRKSFDLVIDEWQDKRIPFSLIFLDIDHFKKVNDTFGHVTGDEVLKYAASTIRSVSREEDLCFRYGGEEFGILVKHGDTGLATDMAEQLRKKIASGTNPTGSVITISLGVSSSESALSNKQLIEQADQALYQSKSEGRNRTSVHGFSTVR
ncbi:sensor domain-containing diguanylate cyclase [Paenibacillus nasutitermitis]|uniref:Cell signaling regulator n=1 Tax=Paenibacillus nasutitermitis TaxID=1652958 RepID=A0A916Z5I9_9BACL|nr:sensor domain-containing diguanylate cyclase [Paenibacillus nasutitermitis]GGD77452.1 cell signaling regulator [Paenibacillus nasutitermitis]